jgi:endonuclease/exonuclease/phosphatase family metal-dependent hydrolase
VTRPIDVRDVRPIIVTIMHPRPTPFVPLLLGAVLGIATLLAGRYVLDRRQAPAMSGTTLVGPVQPREATGSFTVAAYNIRTGRGMDDRRDVTRNALDIAPFDLVLLNEVDGRAPGFENQAHQIAELNQAGWLFAPREMRQGRMVLGNAMVSRLPIVHWSSHPMRKTKPDGYRNFVLASAEVDGRSVRIVGVHTDGSEDRDEQVRILIDLFRSLEPPVILLGDFNTRRDHPLVAKLLADPEVVEPMKALGQAAPENRIDWIFARGLKATEAGMFDNRNSDHPIYWARFEFIE